MADLQTAASQETSDGEGLNTEAQVQDKNKTTAAAASEQKSAEDAVTFTPAQQAVLERVVEDRLARQRSQFKKQEEDAKAKAEAQRLAEQGEFKMLADQRAQRITELENEIKEREQNTLRATVAARHKLPEHWISRLVGETETEIDADAARIAKDLAPPKAPNAEGGTRAGGQSKAQLIEKARQDAIASGRYAA